MLTHGPVVAKKQADHWDIDRFVGGSGGEGARQIAALQRHPLPLGFLLSRLL
jgi:hypothetical protein